MATKFDVVRNKFMDNVQTMFENQDYEVLETGSNELCLPIVGDDGAEGYMVITFKIPKGSRDGEPYDGYAMAEDYKMKCNARAEKVAEALRKKQAKIAKDEKARAEKARLKAEREKRD